MRGRRGGPSQHPVVKSRTSFGARATRARERMQQEAAGPILLVTREILRSLRSGSPERR